MKNTFLGVPGSNSFIYIQGIDIAVTVTVKKPNMLERLRKYRLVFWKAAELLKGINNGEDITFFYIILAGTNDPEVWFNA